MSYQSRQFMQQITKLQQDRDRLIQPEVSPDLISPFLALPMLRGFWAASVDSAGIWYDISGHGRHLAYNGNPTHNYVGLVPYWDLDGTGDYFSRGDEADLDIIGTETYVAAAARGLTVGGWFWFDTVGINLFDGIMCKGTGVAINDAYQLVLGDAGGRFYVQFDGGGVTRFATCPSVAVNNTWYFIVARFIPSTEVALFHNGTWTRNAVAVMASLNNSPADFEIGRRAMNNTYVLDGRAACPFLCAAACSDAQIGSVFQQTRGAFGV